MQGLKDDVEAHCSNGDYRDKTVMFCWEHKTIPYIVAKFGLTTDELSWGLDPIAGVSLLVAQPELIMTCTERALRLKEQDKLCRCS